jgi:hypothetical protein
MYKVYLISDGSKQKIGFTRKKIEERIKQLKTGNSQDLMILGVFESRWGTKIESLLHKKYQYKKVSGEWFNLTEEDIMTFELQCQEMHNVMEDITKNSTWVLNKKI